ncbi:DNRLRE domain-containing protein [candidate division KSB1 bacterium]|nr:DNRLRE domain-containing protein [candidate division KSB1 bacterium]
MMTQKATIIFVLLMFIALSPGIAQDPHYILNPEADTYISGRNNGDFVHGHPDSTGDNYVMLVVKNEGEPVAGNGFYREAMMRFDLSPIEEKIEKVELRLWNFYKASWPEYEDTLRFGAYLIKDDGWDEQTLTWNMAPIPEFDIPLEVVDIMALKESKKVVDDPEHGSVEVGYYGWTTAGVLDAAIFENERAGDGKISFNIWGKSIKVYGETGKTWHAFVSKDSAAMVEDDIAPRLLVWVEGGSPVAVEGHARTDLKFELRSNYPNPFNPSTTITYSLAKKSVTKLMIYNALGQPIRTMTNIPNTAGIHSIIWNGLTDKGDYAPTGVYFYKLSSGDYSQIRKMILMK